MISIELFACAGGMAEGFRRAGLAFSVVVDHDEDACASYEANLGRRPLRFDVNDLHRLVVAGWRPAAGTVGLFVADPPCTPWSSAGKRKGVEDERDCLRVTCDLIALVRPRCWLVANVPGLDTGPHWPIVQRTIGSIPGYCVDYVSLDAADYGVPQHRVRPFWFGHPLGTPCIAWPEPTHCDPRHLQQPMLPGIRRLERWRTCRDALGHLTGKDLGAPVYLAADRASRQAIPARRKKRKNVTLTEERSNVADQPSRTVSSTRGGMGNGALLLVPGHPACEADAPARTQTASDGTGGCDVLLVNEKHPPCAPDKPSPTQGGKERQTHVLAWPWDRPATAVMADDRIAAPGHHPPEWRSRSHPNAVKLSERARALLQGFPEGWIFKGKTKASRDAQIGMAMPPPLAEAVATKVREWMGR